MGNCPVGTSKASGEPTLQPPAQQHHGDMASVQSAQMAAVTQMGTDVVSLPSPLQEETDVLEGPSASINSP